MRGNSLMAGLLRKLCEDKYLELMSHTNGLMFSLRAGKLRHQVSSGSQGCTLKPYTDCKDQVAKHFTMQKMQQVHGFTNRDSFFQDCLFDASLCVF